MKLTTEVKSRLQRDLADRCYPEAEIRKLAEKITAYLASEECVEMEVVRELVRKHPSFIGSYSHSCQFYAGWQYGDFLAYCVKLPFGYPRRDVDCFHSDCDIMFFLNDKGELMCRYGIELPDELKKTALEIITLLSDKARFKAHLGIVMKKVNSTEKLMELIPEAKDVIEAESGEKKKENETDDLDAINRILGGK